MDTTQLLVIFLMFVKTSKTYENLALRKPAWHLIGYPNNPWGAHLAVDGNTQQCAISADGQSTAEWRVDLGDYFSIHYIFIQYRTDNQFWDRNNQYTGRFLGFSVYISNTTNKEDGTLCFKDTSYTRATIPNPTNITCINHGRYIIYYNNRTHSPFPVGYSSYAFSEVCEVQVYGCKTSFYGENCSIPCPENCQESHCNIVDGTCLGCVTGYTGPRCDKQCKDNTYGLECAVVCGNCRDAEQCNHVNGSCPNGCDKGTHGAKCDKACPSDSYGYNCQEKCSTNCGEPAKCDRLTGLCEHGCPVGWNLPTCKAKCDGLRYGQNCSKTCGSCFGDEQCHFINGTCLNGCKNGFWGDRCHRNCAKSFIFESGDISAVMYSLVGLIILCFALISFLTVKVRRLKKINVDLSKGKKRKAKVRRISSSDGYDQLTNLTYENSAVLKRFSWIPRPRLPSTWELKNLHM